MLWRLTKPLLLSLGLDAARSFIDLNAGHLEQLDLAFLLNFGPLQEVVIEKLGTRPELFSSIGLTVTEYLKQAPPHDMRLFIWTLEEHRDEYVSCHTILDEYFDMMGTYIKLQLTFDLKMHFCCCCFYVTVWFFLIVWFSDGHCSVLKKSDETQNVSGNLTLACFLWFKIHSVQVGCHIN